mgnify:CR=1 FL=1
MAKAVEIPVYLFTGFLEGGKTRFIRETLEDKKFNAGEHTLLVLCEEGEEEYDLSHPLMKNVHILPIESEEELTAEKLGEWQKIHRVDRVVIEYNGMWLLQRLYEQMPQGWMIYQEVMLADYNTFLSYNTNMRSLMVDKLTSCEMVLLNRAPVGADKMEIHKVIRGVSRRTDIGYDYVDGSFDYDEIEDPLPFDINAPVIEIGDNDFAVWYRDLTEEMEKYQGKTVRFKGRVVTKHRSLKNCFVCGRHVMTCCVEDIQFCGIPCRYDQAGTLEPRSWVMVTAKITAEKHPLYKGEVGPVLTALEVTKNAQPADPDVATF